MIAFTSGIVPQAESEHAKAMRYRVGPSCVRTCVIQASLGRLLVPGKLIKRVVPPQNSTGGSAGLRGCQRQETCHGPLQSRVAASLLFLAGFRAKNGKDLLTANGIAPRFNGFRHF